MKLSLSALIGIRNKVPETECNGFFTEESLNVRYPSVCFQKPGTNGPSRDMDAV